MIACEHLAEEREIALDGRASQGVSQEAASPCRTELDGWTR